MRDKLGPYINQLMTTIVDKEADDFVKELAISELERLKVDLNSFLLKHIKEDTEENSEETIKQLLQEQKDVKQEEK
tara:strand:+ start:1475 stop:1702 length:228 start_codon:yes stop_codon:yes gene_type:complete